MSRVGADREHDDRPDLLALRERGLGRTHPHDTAERAVDHTPKERT